MLYNLLHNMYDFNVSDLFTFATANSYLTIGHQFKLFRVDAVIIRHKILNTCCSKVCPRYQPSLYESSGLPPVLLSSCLPLVPTKFVQRIQVGLFIEMGKLSSDRLDSPDLFASERSTSSHSKVPEVSSIIEWVQCFSVFIAVVHRSQPDCTPDLLGYQNLIMQISMLGEAGRWILCDRHFHLKASALRLQRWSAIDITVWHLAFPELSPRSAPISCSH